MKNRYAAYYCISREQADLDEQKRFDLALHALASLHYIRLSAFQE